MLTERQLEHVVAIAETGTFTAAAERCHVAQSALSHQISRLEHHLRARLFERSSRSVRLTEAGQSLLPVARRVLGEMAGIRDESAAPSTKAVTSGAARTASRSASPTLSRRSGGPSAAGQSDITSESGFSATGYTLRSWICQLTVAYMNKWPRRMPREAAASAPRPAFLPGRRSGTPTEGR
jgi:hypothetical protein